MKSEKQFIKIYKITFIEYTNYSYDTVYSEEDDKFIKIPENGLLITENDIIHFQKYGKGIKTLEYVGSILKEMI